MEQILKGVSTDSSVLLKNTGDLLGVVYTWRQMPVELAQRSIECGTPCNCYSVLRH